MTIIAYHKGVLYSDRIQEHPLTNFANYRHSYKKLFVNKDKTIAFCYTGLDLNEGSLESIFMIFQGMFELSNKIDPVKLIDEYVVDSHIDMVIQSEKRFYLVMTKTDARFIKEGIITDLDKRDFVVDGLDGEYFQALALTGMEPNKIIPYIHHNLSRRVTERFDFFRQDRLKELKFIYTEVNNNEAIEKLSDKLKTIVKGES